MGNMGIIEFNSLTANSDLPGERAAKARRKVKITKMSKIQPQDPFFMCGVNGL
jgi:hypothetical protein